MTEFRDKFWGKLDGEWNRACFKTYIITRRIFKRMT